MNTYLYNIHDASQGLFLYVITHDILRKPSWNEGISS